MRTLRVMTYNIQGDAARRDPGHVEEVARVISEAEPDVACLQEIHCRTRSGADQAEQLARLTGLSCTFGRSCEIDGGDYGNAILSRTELSSPEAIPLPGAGEPRSTLRAEIQLDGTPIAIFVTHLSAWGFLRRRSRLAQIERLGELLASSSAPAILAGDLNVRPRSVEIRTLISNCGLAPAGDLSEPTHRTRQRLDYIFCDERWTVRHTEVLHRGPSDHWPVISELALETS